jgi:hypothetical protein
VTRAVLVPGVLALLPEYAGIDDPVADLRAACLAAVGWLGTDVTVLADDQGARVAAHLLEATTRDGDEPAYLVVGNGSARRTEKAPGHLDERAAAFDEELARRLKEASTDAFATIDRDLADELWASVAGIVEMARLPDLELVQVDYDDDPYGVQYWVLRWCS